MELELSQSSCSRRHWPIRVRRVLWVHQAGAIWHYECAVGNDRNTRAETARAAEYNRYIGVAGNAVPFGIARVTRSTLGVVLLAMLGNTCLIGVTS